MAEHEEGGAKELFHTITSHPALLVAVLAGGGLVVFLLVRGSPQGQASTTASNGSYSAGGADLQTLLDYGYTVSPPSSSGVPFGGPSPTPTPSLPNPTPVPTPSPVPTPTVPPAVPANPYSLAATTRNLWSGQAPGGSVPIFNAAYVSFEPGTGNPTNSIGGIPLNSQINVGNGVQGSYAGKIATYYPVTYNGVTGYIGSWDLAKTP